MILKNVSQDDLEKALETVNKIYDGNVIFNRFDRQGKGFAVTLRVRDSKDKGHSLGRSRTNLGNLRRLTSACWHVHGFFFDALPKGATIYSGAFGMTRKPGDKWLDRNVGSLMEPQRFSDKCDCWEDVPKFDELIYEKRTEYILDKWGN